ncbi:hypothetical protein AYO38_00080 [bacterium SCGC AG-212-C10]|nr:hypothetical protein AYO38_00080 [bacterium SCGC AG-212-C10]
MALISIAAIIAADGLQGGEQATAAGSWTLVAAGRLHTCGIAEGSVKCWGLNTNGRLGDNTTTMRTSPVNVQGIAGVVVDIDAGEDHTCAVTQSGAVYCWGANQFGQLGHGTADAGSKTAQIVGGVAGATHVSAGDSFTCATAATAIYCWGNNTYGQLGIGSKDANPHATPAALAGTANAKGVSTGGGHSCAVMSDDHVKCWGAGHLGQLGTGQSGNNVESLTPIANLVTGAIDRVTAGYIHTCVILSTSHLVQCWGANADGQLGDESSIDRPSPVTVHGITGGATDVSGGERHTCAVVSGAVKCWGTNTNGEVGDGTYAKRLLAVQVFGLTTGATSVAGSGDTHSCAVVSGVAKCWGANFEGQLGQPSVDFDTNKPVDVATGQVCYAVTRDVKPTSGHGSITLSPPPNCGTGYTPGTAVTFTAVPVPGTTFDHWTGNAPLNTNPFVMTIDFPTNEITAHFTGSPAPVCARLNIVVLPKAAGTVNASPLPNYGTDQYAANTVVTLTASSNRSNSFDHWSEPGGNDTVLQVTTGGSDQTVTANYRIDAAVPVLLAGMEVTQGIQDVNNTTKLIEGRPTMVRAHLARNPSYKGYASGTLTATRNGQTLAGSPLKPLENMISTAKDTTRMGRAAMKTSLNFILPPDWLSGTVELKFQSQYFTPQCSANGSGPDYHGITSDCTVSVTFTKAPPIRVTLYDINWKDVDGGEHTVSTEESTEIVASLLELLPVPRIALDYVFTGQIQPTLQDNAPDSKELINIAGGLMLYNIGEMMQPCTGSLNCQPLFALGVVADGAAKPVDRGVLRSGTGLGAAVFFDTGRKKASAPTTVAAELGLAFGTCKGGETVPFPEGTISGAKDGLNAYFGLGLISQKPIPSKVCDLMNGEHSNRWASKRTWELVANRLQNGRGLVGAGSVAPTANAVASGSPVFAIVGATTTTGGSLNAIASMDAPVEFTPAATGAYSIRLLGAGDAVLSTTPFDPGAKQADGSQPFVVLVPRVANAQAIALFHGEVLVESKAISATAPVVTLLDPLGGQSFSGANVPVHWNASDADGDALSYAVQYSTDSGATWQAIAVALTASEFTIPRTALQGSTHARIRVVASDGVLTGASSSTSDFTVLGNGPSVTILTPSAGQTFIAGSTIIGQVNASDREDGFLIGASITWSSNLNGPLGTGDGVTIPTSSMTEGVHTVTVTATDSNGMATSKTVTVTVLRESPDVAALQPSDTELLLQAALGDASGPEELLILTNASVDEVDWTVTPSAPWLTATSPDGSTPAEVTVKANLTGLAIGTYTGNLHFTAGNLVLDVPVTLTIRQEPADATCDGAVTADDAVRVLRIVASIAHQPPQCGADANSDGQVTLMDSLYILRTLAGVPIP